MHGMDFRYPDSAVQIDPAGCWQLGQSTVIAVTCAAVILGVSDRVKFLFAWLASRACQLVDFESEWLVFGWCLCSDLE